MAIEQLWYTWAEKGLDGRGRLQPVAATPRLHRGGGGPLELALQLCRLDPVPHSDTGSAFSYGWITDGPSRFAFLRQPAGLDGAGRPGNFSAHVLAGPVAELPADRIVSLATSPSWWRGDAGAVPVDGILPTTSLERFLPGRRLIPPPDAAAILSAVLAGRGRGTCIDVPPLDLLGTLTVLSETVPDMLEVLSFSSFECGEPLDWFGLAGTMGSPVSAGADRAVLRPVELTEERWPSELATAHQIVHGKARARERLRRAWRTSVSDPWGALCSAGLSAQLVSSGTPLSRAEMLRLLQSRASLELLEHSATRRTLVGYIVAGDRDLLHVLSATAPRMDAELLLALGADFVDQLESGASFDVCARAIASLPSEAFAPLVDRVIVMARDHVIADLPDEVLREALTASAGTSGAGTVPSGLVALATKRLPELESRRAVQALTWISVISSATQERLISQSQAINLLRAVRDRPDVRRAAVRGLPAHLTLSMLNQVDPLTAVVDVAEATSGGPSDVTAELVRSLLASCSVIERLHALHHVRTSQGIRNDPGMSALVSETVLASVVWILADVNEPQPLDVLQSLCRTPPTARMRALSAVLVALRHPEPGTLRGSLAGIDLTHRQDVGLWSLDAAVWQATNRADVARAAGEVASIVGLDVAQLAEQVLTACLRCARAQHQLQGAEAALAFVATQLVRPDRLTVTRGRRLTDHPLQELAEQAVTACRDLEPQFASWLVDGSEGGQWVARLLAPSWGMRLMGARRS